MKTIFAFAGIFSIASFASLAQQPFQIDHFKCYFPLEAGTVQPVTVLLKDQFGSNPATVGKIFRFCNPAKKFHNGVITPIMNPDDHMTLHQTGPQPLVTRQVKIRNQFGDQLLTTQDARILAVPTQKDPHGPPKALNHFSCYAVANGPVLNVPIGLSDQFFPSRHQIMRPLLFCNPVEKTHNGVVTPITDPDDHLTCYTITRVPFVKDVTLHNQFGDLLFRSSYTDLACVPTRKLGWRVID